MSNIGWKKSDFIIWVVAIGDITRKDNIPRQALIRLVKNKKYFRHTRLFRTISRGHTGANIYFKNSKGEL